MAVCTYDNTSAAIVQDIPPEATEKFCQWQQGVTEVVAEFPGYRGTDVYPPVEGRGIQWVTVIHFEDRESLDRWVDSPERRTWLKKLPVEVGGYELKRRRGGFSPWFADLNQAAHAVPSWKMACTVLLALYPTMMLLTIFVLPHLSFLGTAGSKLVGNALSVALLQWALVPAIKVPLRPWLEAEPNSSRLYSAAALVAIATALVGMSLVFRHWIG